MSSLVRYVSALFGLFISAVSCVFLAWKRWDDDKVGVLHACAWSVFLEVLALAVCFFHAAGVIGPQITGVSKAILLLSIGAACAPVRYALQLLFSTAGPRPLIRLLIVARDAVLIVIAVFVSFFLVELPWNDAIGSMPVPMAFASLIILAILFLLLYLLFQRSTFGIAFGLLFFAGVGLAQFFVMSFKGAAIVPSDVLSLRTAAAVASGYVFNISQAQFDCLSAAFLCIVVLSLLPAALERGRSHAVSACVNVALFLIGTLGAGALYSNVKLHDVIQTDIMCWDPVGIYKYQGFIPSFVTLAQNLKIAVPESYDEGRADGFIREEAAAFDNGLSRISVEDDASAQFAQEKPCVVAVMNETYSDISLFTTFNDAYAGARYPYALSDAALCGSVTPSVLGGGTANSEFEFFSSASQGYNGAGKTAYTIYDLSRVNTLPSQFKNLGYDTVAYHPNNGANYNRTSVYDAMGFDEFHTIEDFAEAEHFHNGVSDKETYKRVLERLVSDDDPQFIFDLTMANHGGYTEGNIPNQYSADVSLDGVGEDVIAQVNEYVGCINRSDDDLDWFIERLRELDRPVVLVFFGDHQPGFTGALNDALFSGEDELTHLQRTYRTPYFIWANYDIKGNDQISEQADMGLNSLGARLLQIIGAPMRDQQKAVLSLQQQLTCVNVNGYMGADGVWYSFDDVESPFYAASEKLRTIQYRFFGSRVQ